MLILMSFSRCLWPPMKLKFKSTEGTLSGKNRSVWNQSTAEWRKIIFFFSGILNFFYCLKSMFIELDFIRSSCVVSHRDTFIHGHIIH